MPTTLNPICVLSGRGGAGKTFFALHLAQLMAIRKSKVLLVDMDWEFAGITQFLLPSLAESKEIEKNNYLSLLLNSHQPSLPTFHQIISPAHSYTHQITWLDGVSQQLGFMPIPKNKEIQWGNNTLHLLTMSSNFIKFLIAAHNLDYNYIIFDCSAGFHPISLVSAMLSNTLLFMSDKDHLSLAATEQLKNWITKEEAAIIQNLEFVHAQDQNWQLLLKQWYKAIRMERKQPIVVINRSSNTNKLSTSGKRWEIPYENKIATAYTQGKTILPESWVQTNIDIAHIDTVYLYTLVKIYQQIAERCGDNVEDLYISDEQRLHIESQIHDEHEQQISHQTLQKAQKLHDLQQALQSYQAENEILHHALDTLRQHQRETTNKKWMIPTMENNQNNNNTQHETSAAISTPATSTTTGNSNTAEVITTPLELSTGTVPVPTDTPTLSTPVRGTPSSLSTVEKQWQEQIQTLQDRLKNAEQDYQANNLALTQKYEDLLSEHQKMCSNYERLRQEYTQIQKNNGETNRVMPSKESGSDKIRMDELRRTQQERDSVVVQYRELYSRYEKLHAEVVELQQQITSYHALELDYTQLIEELNLWKDHLDQLRQRYSDNSMISDVLLEFTTFIQKK